MDKTEQCLECRKKTITYYKYKLKDKHIKANEKNRFNRLLKNIQQEVSFLEKLNKKNQKFNKK